MKALKVNGDIVTDNEAWIYDYLGIDYASPELIRNGLGDANGDPVTVEINSGGGVVTAGTEIYTMLRKYSGKVTTQVVGMAASAASLIAMAGDVVEMSPAATMMIHKASTVAAGNINDLENAQNMLAAIDDSLANAYAEKTGMDHDEILGLMDSTYWITPQEAIGKGFADRMMFEDSKEPLPAVASFGGIRNIEKLKQHLKKSIALDKSEQLAFLNAQFNYLKLGGNTHD
ncbi:head maturation protease, ClpP-related [Levilactobacillus humaensis]|uniref:head maturation protease, ClpP-related n=1 Tax=Levilactobacillus humaensis TaxID=2950375 RepID=UPI0021C38C83|nr:head maturation protease, ClpP-related [Levilactobacillus humaensis]